MKNKNEENFKSTIFVDTELNNILDNVITINSSYSNMKDLDENYSYTISPDGKVIFNDLLNDLRKLKANQLKDKSEKELLIDELIKYGFEKVPTDLNETQLKSILEFSIAKIIKNIEYGQFHPFSVEKAASNDLFIILLMYNGNTLPFAVETLPFKLKDADEKVIFAGSINLDKAVSPKKTGIYYIKINKNDLKEDSMDLSKWTITFDAD